MKSKPTRFQFICLFAGWAFLWLIAFYFLEKENDPNPDRLYPLFTQISSALPAPSTAPQ